MFRTSQARTFHSLVARQLAYHFVGSSVITRNMAMQFRAIGRNFMTSKWETETASDVCAWIQRATGVSVPSDDPSDFAEALKNGQTLCQLANMIQPGSIKKINKMKTPFMMMENIGWFSDFVTAFGVQREYGFVTVDLYEKRNVYQVLLALKWLKVEAEKKNIKL